jgi:DNA-binding transcriptional LysR family regulator
MDRTIRLDDMRLFASVADAATFTEAARRLGMPKQTLSRRIAELEAISGVKLLHRTTRSMQLTESGAAYAERCADVVRRADDANRALVASHDAVAGLLRVTADPVFGEAFLEAVVLEFLARWPEVRVELVLTTARVDVVGQGFDLAFRVGRVDDDRLTGSSLGPARVQYCASAAYLARRGAPATPDDLVHHDVIVVAIDGKASAWPFRGPRGVATTRVVGRLTTSSFRVAHRAALAGLGIAIFPEFACADEVRAGRLVPVLDDWRVDVGSIWLIHGAGRFLPARVRAFVEAVRRALAHQPWLTTTR